MTALSVPADVSQSYVRVQQFYAMQMQRLDARDIPGYAATFTEDAEFAHTPGRAPARTRQGIVDDLTTFHQRFADDPMQRRHLVSMIDLRARPDGSLGSTAYCLVTKIRPGQAPVFLPCVMHDVLVVTASEILTRSRRVDHDAS